MISRMTHLAKVKIIIGSVISVVISGSLNANQPSRSVTIEKSRHIILTDIGGDPDDEQSLVRLLVYANEFDLQGIILEHWAGKKAHRFTPEQQMDLVRNIIQRYGQIRDNLLKHAPGYPEQAELERSVKRGKRNVEFTLDKKVVKPVLNRLVGEGLNTEGSDWIIAVVDQEDPRPVDISVWGGPADLAQALWKVRETRTTAQVEDFVAKIRVHAISDQDDTGPWIRKNFPNLFYILNHSRSGNKWRSCYRGMFLGGDESLTSLAWVNQHVRFSHGPLGEIYPPKAWTGPNKHRALKEGDTPAWFYFLNNGLQVPAEPSFGGWGGRYLPNGTFFQDAQDAVDGTAGGPATVWRWRPAYQNAFQARMDWCVKPFAQANHPPVAAFRGDVSRDIITLSAKPGELIVLDAAGSIDPDHDPLSYQWWIYKEAGDYANDLCIESADQPSTHLQIPADASGHQSHVVLEIKDQGEPNLHTYRRIIIKVDP